MLVAKYGAKLEFPEGEKGCKNLRWGEYEYFLLELLLTELFCHTNRENYGQITYIFCA